MNLLQRLRGRGGRRAGDNPITIDDWLRMFSFGGHEYPLGLLNQTSPGGKTQELLPTLTSLAQGALRGNGIVWSCVMARQLLISEAQFQFRRQSSVASGDLFGTPALVPLEQPWLGGSTRELLSLLDLYTQLEGNGYAFRDPSGTLRVPRADWMTIVLGCRNPRPDFQVWDIDTEILGYIYRPFGQAGEGAQSTPLLVEEVAHFKPHPDPVWQFRGMSWLNPVVTEIMADTATTEHKQRFFEQGATPNMVVTLDPSIQRDDFEEWVDAFEDAHSGALNAYKTIYLAGGADAKTVGSNFKDMDLRNVQAHEETRICIAAGIPPIVVGVSEGLDASTYTNFPTALRAYGDTKLRPLWDGIAGKLGGLIDIPAGCELTYDPRRIPFLQQSEKDEAEIRQTNASTLSTLVQAGYEPVAAATYVSTGDLSDLVHTGLFSVQLQPPGTNMTTTSDTGATSTPGRLWCSLCGEPAGSNPGRCRGCEPLAEAIAMNPSRTIGALMQQLGVDEQVVLEAFGMSPPDTFELTYEVVDQLTPTQEQIDRAAGYPQQALEAPRQPAGMLGP